MIINPFHRLRKIIAEEVDNRMMYMMTCPNERDTILWIIDSYDYPYNYNIHCGEDCCRPTCHTYQTIFKNKAKKLAKTYVNDLKGNAQDEDTKC